MQNPSSDLEALCKKIFDRLARTFPVACASDEFFYFPQVTLPDPEWETWDGFSKETVTQFVRQMSAWEEELQQRSVHTADSDVQMDITLLKKITRTLIEQLSEVRVWQCQPSFYLTLVCIGLAEAVASGDPEAKRKRAKGLPAFLDQAGRNLDQVPLLFQNLGLEMVRDTRDYLVFLEDTIPELKPALLSLDRFEKEIRHAKTREDYLLPQDLLHRIIRFHIGCETDIPAVSHILDSEIDDMQQILKRETAHLLPNTHDDQNSDDLWKEAMERIPLPPVGERGLIGLYEDEVHRLAQHCMDQGLVSPHLAAACPVRVAPVPSFLSAIRSSSSYSIPPGHPPSGGTFYIINPHCPDEAKQAYHREYRMLSAHETYPGHHLLDTMRWSLTRFSRRAFEQPIFYEGWACFAEDILRITGYFSHPGDLMLLAKRRLWRAIRGKVAIGLQSGSMDIPRAARYLEEIGFSPERALSTVRKYLLNPGYQLCYTIGLRRFLEMYHAYGHNNIRQFTRMILDQGEIRFTDLEKQFKKKNN